MVIVTEHLRAHEFFVYEVKPSRISPNFSTTVLKGIYCPHCAAGLPAISHGQTQVCPTCGLIMTLQGNSLTCTVEMGD